MTLSAGLVLRMTWSSSKILASSGKYGSCFSPVGPFSFLLSCNCDRVTRLVTMTAGLMVLFICRQFVQLDWPPTLFGTCLKKTTLGALSSNPLCHSLDLDIVIFGDHLLKPQRVEYSLHFQLESRLLLH